MTIFVQQLIPIENPEDYKVHFATHNTEHEPLDLFVRDPDELVRWNEFRYPNKNDFTRDYIFYLIKFYPEDESWLFGGIFSVQERRADRYVIAEQKEFTPYVGRLIVKHPGPPARGRAFNFENHYENLVVSHILKERYSGESFPGYDRINHDFSQLQAIFQHNPSDWKTALEGIEAVYAITDKSDGRVYVGSAYGNAGLWSRWKAYMETGHGGSSELSGLIDRHGMDYAKNFTFSILEYRPLKASDREIRGRESHWKKVLMTRDHGLNRN